MYTFNAPLEVSDFSGGLTDNYIDGAENTAQTLNNFYITKNRKIITRPGRLIYNSTYYQIPAGNQRVGALIVHPASELFIQSARALYYISSGWQTLTGPVSSNPAFSANAVTNYISWDKYRKHTFLVSDSFSDPIKVYKDSTSTWRVRTAGLPRVDLEGAIDLANDLKAKYNLHRVSGTRHGANDTVNVISASDAYNFDTLVTLITELLTDINAHLTDAALAAAWVYHRAQENPSQVLSSTTAPTSVDECLTRLDDIKAKFNSHDANNTTHNVGASNVTSVVYKPAISGGAGSGNYLYRFCFYYEYTVGDVIFRDFGPTLEVEANSLDTGTKSITSIPVISNGTTRCYDTASIKVKICRTENDGKVFYIAGEVTNGTTTFSDTVSDTALADSEPLYTNGGALDNDPPPPAKFFKVVNNVGFYANVKEGTINYPSRFRVSKPDDVDSCPESFVDDVEDDITGLSSIATYPILFCRERFYRLEGFYSNTGTGGVAVREVSRVKGSVSNRGIVQIPQGLVFPGVDGFYFTEGYNVQPISIHLVETYRDIVSSTTIEQQIEGIYDSKENRVIWTVQRDSSSSDNDAHFILDLNYGIKADSVFCTHDGGDSWRNTCLTVYNGTILMGDKRGYIFKFDENTLTDPKVDTTVAPSLWQTQVITYDYTSFATSFGTSHIFKFVPFITIEAKNETNISLQINSNNNDSNLFEELKEVRFLENITWGDPTIIWNDTEHVYAWNVAKIVDAKRRFPAGSLRCNYKQVQFTNAYTYIYRSDDFSVASIDASAHTVTLDDSTFSWPSDVVDYFISFETDTYTLDYEITERNSATVITYSDPANTSSTLLAKKWIIKGYRKGEVLNLLSYSIRNAYITSIQNTYKGNTGGNV